MNDKRCFQNGEPILDGRSRYAHIFGNRVHGKKLTAVYGAYLNEFLENREVVRIDLITYIEIKIGVDVAFVPIL